MKGMHPVSVIFILVFVILVLAFIFGGVLKPAKAMVGDPELHSQISFLCIEWTSTNCGKEAAEFPPFERKVNGVTKSLAQMCVEYLGSSGWDDQTYNNCKEICVGCP